MDVVKIRLQAQTQHPVAPEICENTGTKMKLRYRGTVDAFAKIGSQEGFFALWRGLGPSVAMTVPSTTIYFALYECFKGELEDRSAMGYWTPLIAGSTARALAVTVTSPLDLFRTNVQSHSREIGALQLFKLIAQSKRWSTLWVGLRPTLWRDVPFSGIYWMCYESVRREINHSRLITSNYLTSLCAGAIAGSIAGVLTLPFDVLKTRTQMHVHRVASGHISVDELPTGMFNHMSQVCATEGVSALFRGLLPRVGKVAPACAIMISSYELVKGYFISKRQHTHNSVHPPTTAIAQPNSNKILSTPHTSTNSPNPNKSLSKLSTARAESEQ